MAHWLTSDPHFGHENIIKYSNRPFDNIIDMNDTIIKNINDLVRPDDVLWILGDFCFHDGRVYRQRIRCKDVNLVLGNHDSTNNARLFTNCYQVADVKLLGQKVVMFHYPMRTWRNSYYGSFHFFGHEHGRVPDWGRSTDVGVDANGFKPVRLDDLIAKLLPVVPDCDKEK